MDILIIFITLLSSFAFFLFVIFVIYRVMPPRLRENVKAQYARVRRRVRFPGNLRNPYAYTDKAK